MPREGGRSRDRDRWGDIYANMPVKKMVALYDYDPQELSPNVDAEVSCVPQLSTIKSYMYYKVHHRLYLEYTKY